MLTDAEFTDLMSRARRGDEEATSALVREYEPEIRRAARLRLTDPRLRRIVDSIDICQSVFGRFFRSAAEGSFELENPAQLLNLLTTMTRNRVIDEHRRQTTAKRANVEFSETVDPEQLIANSPGPRTAAAARELLQEVRSRMTQEELAVADLRGAGKSWDEIAIELNESAEKLRKLLERSLERVRQQLNVAESS